ncbi:MAG: pitrilysin family protein [Pseudomonadota bacterium]
MTSERFVFNKKIILQLPLEAIVKLAKCGAAASFSLWEKVRMRKSIYKINSIEFLQKPSPLPSPKGRGSFAIASIMIFMSVAANAANLVTEIKSGGNQAWLMEDHSQPIITVKIQFENSGSAYDSANLNGVSYFTTQMLTEGAGELNALAFTQELEQHAIRLGADSDQDDVAISLQTLTEYKDKAVELLSDAINKPRFDKDAIERKRAEIITSLKQLEQNPNYIAAKEWKTLAFPNHRYKNLLYGTLDSATKIKRDDLVKFHKNLVCQQKNISIVGDIKKEDAEKLLSKLFTEKYICPYPESLHASIQDTKIPYGDKEPVVIKKSIPQTVIQAGFPALKRDDKNYYAMVVMNHLLGGGTLTSRLIKEIRDKRGLAYYAGSAVNELDHSAFISINFATRSGAAYQAVQVFLDELQNINQKGFSKSEVEEAKSYLTGSFPLNIDSQASIANYLIEMQKQNLGIDYLEKRNSLINEVTLDMVNNLAKSLISSSNLPLIVMVGEPEKAVSK